MTHLGVSAIHFAGEFVHYLNKVQDELDAAAPKKSEFMPAAATFNVGKLQFKRGKHAMRLRLPSGRSLIYWYPSLKEAETPWGERRIVI